MFKCRDASGHQWGFDDRGCFKPSHGTLFERRGKQIMASTGTYANYYMGASGNHGDVCGYGTGNDIENIERFMAATAGRPESIIIQSNAIGVQDGYAYSSSRWGRANLVLFYPEMIAGT